MDPELSDQHKYDNFFGANLFGDTQQAHQGLPTTLGPVGVPPNLRDLLELHEGGIEVVWPNGFDYNTAETLVESDDNQILS